MKKLYFCVKRFGKRGKKNRDGEKKGKDGGGKKEEDEGKIPVGGLIKEEGY